MRTLTFIFLMGCCFVANAQKLPDVQQASLVAPANVKVDGRLTEWGDKLQAYNKETEIYYTIANNKDYLYLTIQATDIDIIDKIVSRGLALTMNTDGNKKDKNSAVVTFPVYENGKPRLYLMLYKSKEIKSDGVDVNMRLDTLKNGLNKKIKDGFKFIGTSGLKGVISDMISLYNAEGILATAVFDENLYYNFELAVPLKLVVGNATPKSINYNIQINGYAFGGSDLKSIRDKFLTYRGADGKDYVLGEPTPRNWSLATPTNFWGEYTLAK
ncbi:hypothetical protein ACFQZS_00090 [Mucilaginibacter calamicampi]|uniref:Uncharacterized protein n=1 Tax=Mucilaginibacter calamicampi TaxID=1302352 RepID=A0ABW2YQR0_9SPHI